MILKIISLPVLSGGIVMNEFLKDKGKTIQEVFPDFSIDIKDWHFDDFYDWYVMCGTGYCLSFGANMVTLRDENGQFITCFNWSDNDEK